jgi:uncharacterized protein
MKFVLLLLVLVGGLWWWSRSHRRSDAPTAPPARQTPKKVSEMVACANCGVHLPETDAVQGEGNLYCCPEHRDAGPAGR